MATVTRAGTKQSLRFCSGTRTVLVLSRVAAAFGKCAHEFPQLTTSGGAVLDLESVPILPDGDYTYDAAPVPVPAPSSLSYPVIKDIQEGENRFFNFMPLQVIPPVPLPLLHQVFGNFVDRIRGLSHPTAIDYEHYTALVIACSTFYDTEAMLRGRLRWIWSKYLGLPVAEEMYTGSANKRVSTATDLGIRETEFYALIALKALKLGISTSRTEPMMQGLMNYRLNWESAQVEEMKLFSDTCYPALLLQHVGQLLLVGGAVMLPNAEETVNQHTVCYQPLTSVDIAPIHGHDISLAMQGVSTCMAIKAAIGELVDFYRKAGKESTECGPDADVRELFLKRIPFPLHQDAVGCEVMQVEKKLVYVLEQQVVKYCQQYGAAVHEAWAEAGFAPKLLSVEHFPGGWTEVRMEYLAEADGWKVLHDMEEADKLRTKVLDVLRSAHKVPVGQSYGVHGDMRDNNVMVKMGDGELIDVRFVDYDWATEEGLPGSNYPGFMNQKITWPKGVAPGMPMLRKHDEALLLLKQGGQLARVEKRRRRSLKQRRSSRVETGTELRDWPAT